MLQVCDQDSCLEHTLQYGSTVQHWVTSTGCFADRSYAVKQLHCVKPTLITDCYCISLELQLLSEAH